MITLSTFYIFLIFYLLILILPVNLSEVKKYSQIIKEDICKNKYNLNVADTNFKASVKLNFELLLCNLYYGIYESTKTKSSFDTLAQNVENMDKCVGRLKESFNNENSNDYYYFLTFSGSRINKIGDERKCIKNQDFIYYLIEMYTDFEEIKRQIKDNIDNSKNTNNNIEDYIQYLELNGFIENNKFYLGLCLWKACNHFFDKFFDRELNEDLFDYLQAYGYTAQNWTFTNSTEKSNDKQNEVTMILALVFIIFIIFIRFILCLSYCCTEENQRKESEYFKLNPLVPSPEEIIQFSEQNLILENNGEVSLEDINKVKDFDNDKNNLDTKKNNIEINKNVEINRLSSNAYTDNLNPFMLSDTDTRISRFSSIITRRKTQAEIFLENYEYITNSNLYELETKSFNSKNLQEISGLKFFLLFFISFYYVYNTFYLVRWNQPGVLPFYQDTVHILFAKLAKMSLRIWIFFDGFQWCFKLLSYIKKLKSNRVHFKHILIFNINIFEKIFVFIILFLIFIYQLNNIGNLKFTSTFEMHSIKFTNVKCYKNPLYILILPILGHTEEIGKYKYCFGFVYILVNELYCIIICSVLFYIFFKFRLKVLENLFLILFFFSILISCVFFQDIKGDLYYQRYVLGEDFSLKSIFLFFHYFFIGCICGLVYYYSTLMNLELEKYNVFENCYKFMYCYITMNHVLRHFLGFLCLFLIMIFCCYYPFLFKLGVINKYRLIKKIDFFTYLVISYENIIQIFLFMIFFFDIILSSEIFTKVFLSNDIFIIFQRCSFIFFIIVEQIVFLFQTFVYLDGVYWNTENILFLSVICFLITLFFSILLVYFIQLPIRFYTKKKERECLQNFEKDYKFKSM